MAITGRPRVRAPELVGRGGWLNTGGSPLSLTEFRGRFVLLDFWTFCCINCLHVLDELRPLEESYGDVLTVVGVHSPKFAHEADHDAVIAAVERYGVHHPVLDDPDLTTWQNYAVRAWPTLTLVDPAGYVVAQFSGEGHAHALDAILRELIPQHEAKGTLRRGDSPYVPPEPEPTQLRFPGKVIALPGGTFLVSDSGNHSLVELADDLETVVRRIGTGERGLVDGGPDRARFSEPQGLTLLPPELHARAGYDMLVADTVNHVLRGVRLSDGQVTTVAGTGSPWMQGDPSGDDVSGDPRAVPMSSPWDVVWSPAATTVVVAMAGIHQLWAFDPVEPSVQLLAGTTNEGLVDGKLRDAWFAQTSGLAVGADRRLWLADSETSSLRAINFQGPSSGVVETAVGTGLFDFGFRDGPAGQALLQHPLGVTALPDGSVAVSDTYNNAVRRYDPATGEVITLVTGVREPSGAVVDGAYLVVVESAAHRLTRVPLGSAATAPGSAHQTQRPALDVAPGEVELVVVFAPPPGQKLDERYGPATRLSVSATPGAVLADGAGRGTELARQLHVQPAAGGAGVLHVAAMAASCDDGGENAACHIHQQDWGIPVRVVDGGTDRIELVLSG
ncbi:NHL domain-containing thioredoxin family protein [Jiangella asiatica]|uniref:Redoxin domain-containing protein n=1 Tax=Jiangella asiatica TaxID=2530372 RepID=A0A4R5CV28_9ACTN|nr:NHL domain-containing thioredoxin family protein [Jiangella asiatica]TDE01633.1 redoxin domain-containing protein [Jiangella asiatica]